MPNKSKRKNLTTREREVWNQAVRATLKEIWLYDGVIPDNDLRAFMVRQVQKEVSFKSPKPKAVVLVS